MFRIIVFICTIFFALITSPTYSQQLNVGDNFPFEGTLPVINATDDHIHLSDLRGKIIIIDFWATWCVPCVKSFSKLNELQNRFPDQVQVLLTASSSETREKVSLFIQRYKQQHPGFNLPVVVADSTLKKLFAFRVIPHSVIIDNTGRVYAVTTPENIDATALDALIKGRKIVIKPKNDILEFDRHKPLFLSGARLAREHIRHQSLLTGYLDGGIAGNSLTRDSSGLYVKAAVYNTTKLGLLKFAYQVSSSFPRYLVKVENPEKFFGNRPDNEIYCYELITPGKSKEEIFNCIQQEFKNLFGATATLRKETLTCYVMKTRYGKQITRSAGGPSISVYENGSYMKNEPVSTLVRYFQNELGIPLIDETSSSIAIDLELPQNSRNMEALGEQLADLNIDLIEEEREFTMFIINVGASSLEKSISDACYR